VRDFCININTNSNANANTVANAVDTTVTITVTITVTATVDTTVATNTVTTITTVTITVPTTVTITVTNTTAMTTAGALPLAQGLYDPAREHDACGVAFVVNIDGRKRRKIIDDGLEILRNLSHRGAVGADPLAGDGAGLLLQMPHRFFAEVAEFDLPAAGAGEYAVGMVFMPPGAVAECRAVVEKFARAEGQRILGWRAVPVDNSGLGTSVLPTEPVIEQVHFSGLEDGASVSNDCA